MLLTIALLLAFADQPPTPTISEEHRAAFQAANERVLAAQAQVELHEALAARKKAVDAMQADCGSEHQVSRQLTCMSTKSPTPPEVKQ